MRSDKQLSQCVVRVNGRLIGTGFFIDQNGSILTCFHLVGDVKTGTPITTPITVTFENKDYAATVVSFEEPEKWDVAILRLDIRKLPESADILPLEKWDISKHGDKFSSFGHKSHEAFEGLYVSGKIEGRPTVPPGIHMLQLSSQQIGSEEIRQGMSGAPIYIANTQQAVGLITSRYREEKEVEIIPLALPTEEIRRAFPGLHQITFVNRDEEMKLACEPIPYILFEAPSGYGKTELLKVIKQNHDKNDWFCLYIETPNDISSAIELAQHILVQANLPFNSLTLEHMSLMLAGSIHKQLASPDTLVHGNKVVLLLDNVERLPHIEITRFVEQFILPLQTGLKPVHLRVRFAGRYIGSWWEAKANQLLLTIVALTPFEFSYIKATIDAQLIGRTELDLYAAHIMHTTGGHPACMAEMILHMRVTEQIDTHFTIEQQLQYYQEIIARIVNDIRCSIPKHLLPAFDTLSVFRRYNHRLLKRILAAKLFSYDSDADSPDSNADLLEKNLTSTWLVKRKITTRFIEDEIVRRLLAIRLRCEEPDQFLNLCKRALEIYHEDLQQTKSISRPELIFIECLYHELQIVFYNSQQDKEARHSLHERFFAEDGILERYLAVLTERDDHVDDLKSLATWLEEIGDKEFQFVVNFFLRGDDYTNTPYEMIVQRVKRM